MDPSHQAETTVSKELHNEHVISSLQSSIAAIPTSGQPVLDTTMKDMLLSLQSSLMTNLSSLIHKFSTDMRDRVQYMENKMEEFTDTVNDLVDAYMVQKDDTMWIKAKLADLEDRSCHGRN